jgi:GH15 family glucan-1,4-alpha-glucosidase
VPLKIEDYAMIGDTQSAALVGRDGSIDWLCLPRFDSDACFAALLGDARHGRWLLAPADRDARATRRYRGETLVLETTFATADGAVRVVDCMPPREARPDVVRVAEGVRGSVDMVMELAPRFEYGRMRPWLREVDNRRSAVAGADALDIVGDVPLRACDGSLAADFRLSAGESAAFVLTWHRSHEPAPRPVDPRAAVAQTEAWWRDWSGRCGHDGAWGDAVVRSLITLKALTYAPTGGIVAAATTSLPEQLGGVRNWDYRFCWLRDAAMTLRSFVAAGYTEEAVAWRDWLLRAVAGDPAQLQMMYGPAGERRLTEITLDWLPGYADSRPVRIGNAAAGQLQLDVFGEVLDAMHAARSAGIEPAVAAWAVQQALLEHLEGRWREPDEGVWEVRSGRRQFTHSKVMAWVAFDRAIRTVERTSLDGPVERWRRIRHAIHEEICRRGYDPERRAFTQVFGEPELDASLLTMPLFGFLSATDPRFRTTVDAIQRELAVDGLVRRYQTGESSDGLPPGEGSFLPCSFWLARALAAGGRHDEAERLLTRLLTLRNDVGLLSEEYDTARGRLIGNFPQAFSHVELLAAIRAVAEPAPGPPQA